MYVYREYEHRIPITGSVTAKQLLMAFKNQIHDSIDSFSAHSLQWRHNGHDNISNHQPHHCLLNRLFGHRSKKTSKLRGPVNSPHKGPVTRKMFPFDDDIMLYQHNHLLWSVRHKSICNCSVDGSYTKQCMYSSGSREGYFAVYFPSCAATKEIKTKITLEWAHKLFVARAIHYFISYTA